MVVRVVRTVTGFFPFAGKPMPVGSGQKPPARNSDSRLYRTQNSLSLGPRSRRSACSLARDEELGVLSRAKKSTATNEGVRAHPALLPRIATVSSNGTMRASTLPYQYGIPET